MEWHRIHSVGASYTKKDAKAHREICQACVQGTMRQASTDHLRVHRPPSPIPGSQFALDAYTHTATGAGKFSSCDLLTDLTSHQVYPIFRRDRGAKELTEQITIVFETHPEWRPPSNELNQIHPSRPRKIISIPRVRTVHWEIWIPHRTNTTAGQACQWSC